MSQLQQIKIQLEGVSNVLKTGRFKVPAYQRSYAWESEHVDSLLADIHDAIKNKESEYFLGSMVVTGPVNQRFEVVDGQQRLTTVTLLIAAIKDRFQKSGEQDVVQSIKNDFLTTTDRKTKEKTAKLVLNEVDNELFQELIEDIQKVNPARFQRQSHARMISAATRLLKYVNDMCDKSRDPEAELHAWLDYLESNLKIIVVSAPDDSNAFVIFETLNDRGLELAISDLLKNYLFHKSGQKLDETKNRWLSMVAILEGASEDPLIVTYLRHFSMSRYGLVREKELFGVIKKKITSQKLALQFSTDLSNTAKIYAALLNADHEFWNRFPQKVRDAVSALNMLGMVQIRPLLLAILEQFEDKVIATAFEKLVSVAVRFQVVGGVGGGTLERIYSETAKSVFEGKLTTIKQILAAFTTLPADAVFREAFAVASISRQSLARYYLRCLDELSVENDMGEVVANKDTTKVNLEHILPVTLSSEWLKTWEYEDARAYQRRLGNLALMSSRSNSQAGNDSFDTKKEEYKKSKFALTSSISKNKRWSAKEINARQNHMAELAVRFWSV